MGRCRAGVGRRRGSGPLNVAKDRGGGSAGEAAPPGPSPARSCRPVSCETSKASAARRSSVGSPNSRRSSCSSSGTVGVPRRLARGRRAGAARAGRTREPNRRRDSPHLARRGQAHVGVEDRRETRELRDEIELAVRERQLGRAADLQLRVPGTALVLSDPVLHQVDPVASPAPYSRSRCRK